MRTFQMHCAFRLVAEEEKMSVWLTDETVDEELVDRGKGEACDGSSGVFRADHFKEGPQENVGFNIWKF